MNLSELITTISTFGLLDETNFWKGLLIIVGLLAALKAIISFMYKFFKSILIFISNQKFKTIFINHEKEGLIKSFQYQDFEVAKKDYIVPNCSNIDPTNSDQFSSNVGVSQNVYDALDNELKAETKKHILILADSGMGKTTLLINYYKRLNEKKRVALLSLSRSDVEQSIKNILRQQETILLLDAFDEDTNAIRDFDKRMAEIMTASQDFMAVLVTCRTQFFLNDSSIPTQTGIARVGSRKTSVPSYYEWKTVYLLPFDDTQVNKYIKSSIPFFKSSERKKARDVVSKIPELALRPMLLSLVPDLIKANQEISEVWELYEFMVSQWANREKHWIDETNLITFSTKLAVDLFLNRERRQAERISLDELERLINVSSSNIEKWSLTGRSLLNRDSGGNFKFAHRSIMEYLFIKAFTEGHKECSTVKWTDMMCELFISLGKCNVLSREKLNEIFNLDLRETGLFPFTQIPQAEFNSTKSWITYATSKTNLHLEKNSVPAAWRSYTSKIIERESLIRVYDFGTGFTFQFIKTFDKNSEEMCLFKVNRYVFEWDDASTGNKWFLPSYSEFKSLTVIMASEDMLNKLDGRACYWLADRYTANDFYLARIRMTSEQDAPMQISGLEFENSDLQKIGNCNFSIDIYHTHIKSASINALLALPISVCEMDASDLWHRDSTCSDESKWAIRPVEHTINFKNNESKKRVHPKLLSVMRKIK